MRLLREIACDLQVGLMAPIEAAEAQHPRPKCWACRESAQNQPASSMVANAPKPWTAALPLEWPRAIGPAPADFSSAGR